MPDGSAGKRDGMARAHRHADPHWKVCILESIQAVARKMQMFTSDDVTNHCRLVHPNATTHELRAIGPMMTQGAKHGYCVAVDRWEKSNQPQCHKRPKQCWWSLIFRGPPKLKKPRPHKPILGQLRLALGDEPAEET